MFVSQLSDQPLGFPRRFLDALFAVLGGFGAGFEHFDTAGFSFFGGDI